MAATPRADPRDSQGANSEPTQKLRFPGAHVEGLRNSAWSYRCDSRKAAGWEYPDNGLGRPKPRVCGSEISGSRSGHGWIAEALKRGEAHESDARRARRLVV